MKRIIIIDCCAANIVFPTGQDEFPVPTNALMSGRLVPAAMLLGMAGRQVTVMGEAGRDPLGDMLVEKIERANVDISCIDRYSDGSATPCTLVFAGTQGHPESVVYHLPMSEQWDSKWPMIDAQDVVLFGGYFALQQRVRGRLTEFLTMARDRGALLVYLPGFNPRLEPAITRVMPYVLENLEMAHAVITATPDLKHVFGTDDPRGCYDNKVCFYSSLMVNIAPTDRLLSLMQGPNTIERQLPAVSTVDGVLPSALQPAMFIDALQQLGISAQNVDRLSLPTLNTLADLTAMTSLSSFITL
ncbi:MAG: carbohydrate kinase family protein [Firmicutes bacterium]|nr:carbohydrate kinase family protein [Bacillota bacterium]MCM1400947.1 carbohydrate kinase family protein [Bacteroides sp.]MCM1476298.1 carbohydrate kinase family protein [Bacteroides sp.]